MSFDLSSLKVLIKKIFPPKKSIYTADTNLDGTADSVIIRAYNVVVPFVIPKEIILEDFDQNDIENEDFNASNYFEIEFDGEPIKLEKKIDKDSIQDKFRIAHQGEVFSFQEILNGKMGGRTLGLGDTLDIIIKLKEEDLKRFTPGKHTLKLEAEIFQELIINFELNDKNMNISYKIE
jgi:hypothetical protein